MKAILVIIYLSNSPVMNSIPMLDMKWCKQAQSEITNSKTINMLGEPIADRSIKALCIQTMD